MSIIKLSTKQYPISLKAMRRSELELELTVENTGQKLLWVEIDVSCPAELSLSPVKELTLGKLRFGILRPGMLKEKKAKFYSGARTAPYEYKAELVLLAHDEDAVIAERLEEKIYIRATD